MSKSTVSLPQGTRDFGPEVVRKRQYILQTIREVFELYAFQPLETPAMENLETLMGKYGEEGDKLIFKILNNGLDHPSKEKQVREDLDKILSGKTAKSFTERALRYDLTIPFARYVAMNFGQLNLPFRRYQIQPVWRADRPQKGRYREFYQCDADVVGSASLYNEIELASIYATVFEKLKLPVEIRINNRKILSALAAHLGQNNMTAITVAIDKLDKIGIEKVKEELCQKGIDEKQLATIEAYLNISGNNETKLAAIEDLLQNSTEASEGIRELRFLLEGSGDDLPLMIDLTLARGLNYYTGTIFEVRATNVQIGSIGGGGRYDDLTGLFGRPDVPGVGISFGVDRIYDVLEELNLFPQDISVGPKVLFLNLGDEEAKVSFRILQEIREKGVAGELYHENAKVDRQFKYAEKKNIPFVVLIGSAELELKTAVVKDLRNAAQKRVAFENLPDFLFI